MVSPQATARQELLHRLLEQYERGRSFGRPSPWARDLIIRLDARHFPQAFHPDGREALAALRAAAEELARCRAVRLVRHRGYAAGVPHEVRIGPDEIDTAYRLAEADGFEPLGAALAILRAHAHALRTSARPDWMNRFLASVEEGAAAADLFALGMARERFKRERHDVLDALTAAAALATGGASGWERVVSERAAVVGKARLLDRHTSRAAVAQRAAEQVDRLEDAACDDCPLGVAHNAAHAA